jgi:Tol biopolymer transport system component/DNA-binding winged helix-turn-helix (wHTH) protein
MDRREDRVMSPVAYEFDDFRVDLRQLSLARAGEVIPLEPKAFDVLRLLIEHRDRLVTKEELLDTVWRDTFVTPNVLTRAVAQLRKALGDDARESRYIQTLTTRGYRFVRPVVTDDRSAPPAQRSEPAGSDPPGSDPTGRRPWLLAGAAVVCLAAAATVAAFVAARGSAGAPDGPSNPRRITTRNGYHGMGAVSADGRLIAYASERATGLELIVIPTNGAGQELIVTSDGGQNIDPSWSPDGEWLAFHSRKRGGIWIVPAAGGTARQIVEFGSDPAWSPDGSRLVFNSDVGGMAAQSVLWTVSRSGGDAQRLTTMGQPPGGHHEPSYSNDGQWVAFVVRRGGWIDEVWRVATAGGTPQRLAIGPSASHPQFAPDDRAVYWGGTVDNGLGRIWRTDPDQPEAGPEPVITLDSGKIDGLSVARNGTVAFTVGVLDANLWSIDVSAGAKSEAVRITDDAGRISLPDYSSDGRIAFVQTIAGNPATVWLIGEDGRGRERLVPDLPLVRAQWVADGSRLLGFTTGKDHHFVWIDAATRRTTRIPIDPANISSARVSPDGRELAYHVIQPDGAMNVFTRPLGPGEPRQITTDREAVSYPAWSPDGRSLAVEIKRGDSTHIGVVPPGGGDLVQLTSERGQSWPHSWAPDNDRIAFAAERDGVWNVWFVSRTSKEVRRLTDFTSSAGYVRYPTWSPRGDRIVFERARSTASVWTTVVK